MWLVSHELNMVHTLSVVLNISEGRVGHSILRSEVFVKFPKRAAPCMWHSQIIALEEPYLMAIRFGSYRPKIWILLTEDMGLFCLNRRAVSIRYLQNPSIESSFKKKESAAPSFINISMGRCLCLPMLLVHQS